MLTLQSFNIEIWLFDLYKGMTDFMSYFFLLPKIDFLNLKKSHILNVYELFR